MPMLVFSSVGDTLVYTRVFVMESLMFRMLSVSEGDT